MTANITTISPEEEDIVVKVRVAMGFLSFFGSLFVVLMLSIRKPRPFATSKRARMVMCLHCASFLEAIANIMSLGSLTSPLSPATCTAQGWLLQFSQHAIFSLMTSLGLNLYLTMATPFLFDASHYLWFDVASHVGIWSWVLLASCIPFASNAYGDAGVWCWIERSGQAYRWALFYIPMFIQIIAVFVLYLLVIRTLNMRRNGITMAQRNKRDQVKNRLMGYPLIFIGCYIFPIIHRIYDAVPTTGESFALMLLQSITAPVFGFAIAVAFSFEMNSWTRSTGLGFTRVRALCCGDGNAPQENVTEVPQQISQTSATDDTPTV